MNTDVAELGQITHFCYVGEPASPGLNISLLIKIEKKLFPQTRTQKFLLLKGYTSLLEDTSSPTEYKDGGLH
jgi:hypothetical protein